jgi:hypothetical protein
LQIIPAEYLTRQPVMRQRLRPGQQMVFCVCWEHTLKIS